MSLGVFAIAVLFGVPLVALALVMAGNRMDRQAGHEADAPTPFYFIAALPSIVLLLIALGSVVVNADTPITDPCSLLEPYSWKWWALGCYWGSPS